MDPEVADAYDDWAAEYVERQGVDLDGAHVLFPPPSAELVREPVAAPVADAEELLELDHDAAAGFAWGSAKVCLLIAREDLEAGRLDACVGSHVVY